jgi:outer membrane cobalamin receptor
MVNTRETETVQKIGSEDLTDFAVDSVEEAVGRQAGVVSRGGELFVRGGRSGEVSFRIGGVAVDNPTGGGQVSVSTFSVQTVETVTGGQDPEYGNALSGVINIETREGSRDNFEFNARFFTDDFGRQDRTYTNYDRFEFGLGGSRGTWSLPTARISTAHSGPRPRSSSSASSSSSTVAGRRMTFRVR